MRHQLQWLMHSRKRSQAKLELRPVNVLGRLRDVHTLARLWEAGIVASIDAGGLTARIGSPSWASRAGSIDSEGEIDPQALAAFLPHGLPWVLAAAVNQLSGRVRVKLQARYAPEDGLVIDQFSLQSSNGDGPQAADDEPKRGPAAEEPRPD